MRKGRAGCGSPGGRATGMRGGAGVFPGALFAFTMLASSGSPVAGAEEGSGMGRAVVGNGRTETEVGEIVTPKAASAYEERAASEVSAYVGRICGKKLQVTTAPGKEGGIFVGAAAIEAGVVTRAELENLRPDGYVVRTRGGRIGIAGYRGVGTLHAAYAFLGELGVKFYAPECRVVPEALVLRVPPLELSRKPAFDFRGGRWSGGGVEQGFSPDEDSPSAGDADPKSGAGWDHTASYQMPKHLYFDSHPEYYAKDESGKNREFGRLYDVQLCLSHPDVRRIATERILEWMDREPQGKYFCVTQGDGGAWCQCPNCRALDPNPGAKGPKGWYYADLTDRLLDYVNAIARETAKKHPDKVILTLAYTPATQPPPRRLKPGRNVKAMFCPYPTPGGAMCNSHDLTEPENAGSLKDLEAWLQCCPENVYVYDYPCGYAYPAEPLGSFYAITRKMKFYHSRGIRGLFFCGGPSLFRDLFNYATGRLMWEPGLDVEGLVDEFMGEYYGAAAPHVRRFFDLLYARVNDPKKPVHTYCEGPNPGLATPAFAKEAYAIFDRAKRAVKDDGERLDRVKVEELYGVLWADLNENTGRKLVESGRVNAELLPKFRKLLEISSVRGIRSFVRGDRENAWLTKALGVPVERQPWFKDPLVVQLSSGRMGAAEAREIDRRLIQKEIAGGLELMLSSFSGGVGPEPYEYNCPRRIATWVNPGGRGNTAMTARFFLDAAPGEARLVLEALDDDKPGATRVKISLNGREVFSGANAAKPDDWTRLEFAVPAEALKSGANVVKIENLEESKEPNEKWFMVSRVLVLFQRE